MNSATDREAYALPLLPPRAKPRLEHRGFREQGIRAAKERLERLRVKLASLDDAQQQLDKDAGKQWVEAFADLRDAGVIQTSAKEMLIHDKDLKVLQERAPELFAEVRWELRHAMVCCGHFILANKTSGIGGLVPVEYFQDCMTLLTREEKELKRALLQAMVGDPPAPQLGGTKDARTRFDQTDASMEGKGSDSEQPETGDALLKFENEQQVVAKVEDAEQSGNETTLSQDDEA